MEKLTKKSIALKIAIVLVIVIIFNFSAPTISQAGVAEVIGGTLLSPIIDLLLAIGDAAVNLIQTILFRIPTDPDNPDGATVAAIDNSLIKVAVHEAGFWETVGMVAGAIVGVAAVVAITIVTGGTALAAIVPGLVAAGVGAYAGHEIAVAMLPDTFYLPVYAISPEEIFQNKIGLLDVNFFQPNDYSDGSMTTVTDQEIIQISTASRLQSTISSWYLTLRNFALVVLLSVLLYIGIRIVTSSAAQDKAKYKEKLSSWIVAMCILFFMHYIMSFATMVVEAISEGINTINKPVIVTMPNLGEEDYEMEIVTTDPDTGETETNGVKAEEWFSEAGFITEDSSKYLWPTNLMGTLRIDMQMDANLSEDNSLLRQLGYVILFLVLVFYTIAFLVVYIKRVIMLAFLTMIAPLVAMTYPLDKLSDGNAQAFNMWIKEYVFNLLIQPFHLILYTMLVGSAIDFAHDNMIYAIVAIGFIFEAEKILKRFFGFDKASTLDTNGSAVGGALAMAGINQLRRLSGGRKGKAGAGGGAGAGKGSGTSTASNRKIKTRELMDQVGSGGNSGQSGRRQLGSGNGNGGGNNPNGKSDEWNRLQGERQAIDDMKNQFGDADTNRETYDQLEREVRESDTRGVRQWIGDAYQGSALQGRVRGASNAVRTGLHSASDYVMNKTPVGTFTRGVTGAARSVRDLAGRGVRAIPKPIRNSARTLGSNIAAGAKGAAAVGMQGLKYAAPRVGKAALKGGLAATAAGIGIAGGLASGNDMNVLKYGAAGAATGWAAGSGAVGMAGGLSDSIQETGKSIASTYTTAAHGAEAEKARQLAIEDKQAMKDKERQKLYADKLNIPKGDIKQVMQEAQEYRANGITDDETIIKAMQAEGFGSDRASKERVLLAGLASEVGNDNKKIKDLESRLSEKGLSPEDVKKYVEGVRNITGAI